VCIILKPSALLSKKQSSAGSEDSDADLDSPDLIDASDSGFSVRFGTITVPAEQIVSNVLRCYTPSMKSKWENSFLTAPLFSAHALHGRPASSEQAECVEPVCFQVS